MWHAPKTSPRKPTIEAVGEEEQYVRKTDNSIALRELECENQQTSHKYKFRTQATTDVFLAYPCMHNGEYEFDLHI
jgi:hypothetical protein